jgi:hypothetical protein
MLAVRSVATFVLGLLLATVLAIHPLPAGAQVSIGISVGFGPPPIPYYVQPPDPYQNYIWSPGYWAYDDGYYWVPGTWVPAPQIGYLWTPGYWAYGNGHYGWHHGYWATNVGFYGGVNYGYGYYGNGYAGGRWQGNAFRYNTAVTRVGGNIHNVYANNNVVVHQWNRVSYNGGRGGVTARPSQSQLSVQRGRVLAATPLQTQHQSYAAASRANFANVNHGRPAQAAVAHPYTASNRPAAYAAPRARAAAAYHAAPQAHAAPAYHAAAAPQAHAAPAYHAAAPAYHAAAPQQMHAAAPQQMHAAAPQQMHAAAPQQRAAAPPQQRAAAPQHENDKH